MSGNEEQAPAPAESSGHSRYGSVISTRPLPLDVERRKPWNRLWRKAIHFWRYGSSHPDEDLLGVIEAVGDVLHVQAITAKAVLTGDAALEAGRIKDELDEELKRRLPDFSTLLGIESRINALYPPEMARRRQWVLRDRFDRVAPSGAMQYWQADRLQAQIAQLHGSGETGETQTPGETADPDVTADATGNGGGGGGSGGDHAPPKPDPRNDSEADAQTLLGYIHTNYLMTIGREKAVRDLKRWLLMRFFLFLLILIPVLVVVWIVLWLYNMGEYWGLLLGLFLIAAAGRAGATTSVINRLQKAISANVLAADPIVELSALRTGKNEISMALLSSSIFALLMWAFFASGVPKMIGLDGGLFPRSSIAQAEVATLTPAADRAGEQNTDPSEPVENDRDDGPESPNGGEPPSGNGKEQATTPPGPPASPPEPPAPRATQSVAQPAPAPAETRTAPPRAGRFPPTPPPPRLPRLVQLETRVEQLEDEYRDRISELRSATGIANWFERRSLRRAARTALTSAVANQQAAISFIVRRQNATTGLEKRSWQAVRRDAELKLQQLSALEVEAGFSDKPLPGVGCAEGKDCNPFPDLAIALRLMDESDFFKMLLWAFIAGFAERFVPDMLDRVVARGGRDSKDAEADAALAAQVRAGTLPSSLPPQSPPPGPRPSGSGP